MTKQPLKIEKRITGQKHAEILKKIKTLNEGLKSDITPDELKQYFDQYQNIINEFKNK